ncbi:ABC transporter ATP-binding protein [Actinoplanes ianthinogenes]|uniref:ABC transporter ATP-binding protein n=1 Tax=Actinoplanes ianthinogenes TaxID=122358 RepID=A0ABM7LJV7_9ACTN|nr:ATP-binding cassette domain-containing protein [Actinoplanes ianthinogenes]BCJ39528.1 ABC transporter ATP-binding protein [Actinoplanes ianthinogenes]GGR35483.1 ABC transporter ATP-binding protein [Actinoplanes ianthinogenes]
MIVIDRVCKSKSRTPILREVSFEARPGRVTGFLGPNGAGKTSTLRVLLGLDRAASGTALVNGRPYAGWPRPLTTVGAALDGSGAHRSRSAHAHLRWVATSNGLPRTRVDEVLDLVGLTGDAGKRAGRFSLGMSRRLGLAAALLGDPPILVLDEPVNGLDPAGIRWMRDFLRASAAEGRTVLLSSHLMGELAEIADDVVVIDKGSVVARGTLAEVTGEHSTLEDAFFALTGEMERPWS